MSFNVFFNDDEEIVPPENSVPPSAPILAGRVKLTEAHSGVAPVEKSNYTVLLTFSGNESFNDRPGLDLVAVLDISGSMEKKIDTVKTAMSFVIKKLSPIDRISIVTFANTADRRIKLTQVTDASRPKLLDDVNTLKADGGTNIRDGLLVGLKVLADRKFSVGRFGGIVLMSDGQQNVGEAATVVIDDKVPVFTFGFGADYDGVLLNKIANNSGGGTFSPINNINICVAFSQCICLMVSVLVDSLKVTVSGFKKNLGFEFSKIVTVKSGSYNAKKDPETDSFTINFGVVYGKEVRKVLVDLVLLAVEPKKLTSHKFLVLEFSGTFLGDSVNPIEDTLIIERDPKLKEVKPVPEVELEEARLNTVRLIRAARDLADVQNLEGAREKMGEARTGLDRVVEQSNPLIGMLRTEVKQLLDLLQSQDVYVKEGRPYALSAETSHGLQRFAARGDIEKMRLFATPRMDKYLEQAKKFVKDPTAPVPSADADVKEEMAANPLAVFAGSFTFYVQAAIQALQGLEKLIANGGRP